MSRAPNPRDVAAILTEIHLGIAMTRAAGVVCGSPLNIRIVKAPTLKQLAGE